jgi:uncharacterized protein
VSQISDVQGLEAVVGSRPLAMMMKSIDRLDDHCRAVIDRSTAAVIAYRDERGLRARVVGVRRDSRGTRRRRWPSAPLTAPSPALPSARAS